MAGLISKDEIIKLSEMKQDEVNISAAQMLVLANNIVSGKEDMKSIISSLEKQAWYKRMWNSLNGKMKGTSEEFEQHKGLIALYAVQAVSVLFKSDKFDMDMNMSIRQKIIDIYYFTTLSDAEKLISSEILNEFRNVLRELAEKLIENAEKTDSVSIITKGMIRNEFNFNNPVVSACVVLSKLDSSILNSEQALDIIRNSISENELFETAEKSISDYMSDVINIPAEKTGVVYLELASMIDNPWATMFSDLIESYNMFPKMERMAKKKDVIIKNIIEKNDLDSDIAFAASDLFEAMFNTKIEMASMTGKVNIYAGTSDNVPKSEQKPEQKPEKAPEVSFKMIEESLKREKRYGVDYGYDDIFGTIYDLPNRYQKEGKDSNYVWYHIPINDYYYDKKNYSGFPVETGRSVLKIVYDNREFTTENAIENVNGRKELNSDSKFLCSGHLIFPDKYNGAYNNYKSTFGCNVLLDLCIPKSKVQKLIEEKYQQIYIYEKQYGGNKRITNMGYLITLEDLHSLIMDYDIIISGDGRICDARVAGRTIFGDIIIMRKDGSCFKNYAAWPDSTNSYSVKTALCKVLGKSSFFGSGDIDIEARLKEDLHMSETQIYEWCDCTEREFDYLNLKLAATDEELAQIKTVLDFIIYVQSNLPDTAKIMPEYHADIKNFTTETKPQAESISQKVEETINPAFSTDIENTEDSKDDNEVSTLSTTETDSLEDDEDDDDDDSEIEEFVIEAICSYLGIDYLDLDIDADLNEDMGVDILDLIDVIEEIEEEFYIDEIDANDLLELRTVRDIIELIEEYYY